MQNRDKGLLEWQGQPLIEHVLSVVSPHDNIIISANQNIRSYESYGYPVIQDNLADFQGPLAGIHAALSICRAPLLMTLPCDNPLPPRNLFQRLHACMTSAHTRAAICHDGNRLQPLYALMDSSLKQSLADYLHRGERRVDGFFQQQQASECDFSDQHDRFENFNSPADMT